MGIFEIFVIFLVLLALARIVSWRRGLNIYGMFLGQYLLCLFTLFVGFSWFVIGQEFSFAYGYIWEIVERGSLEALASVMGIVGVGSVLLGWSYSGRDKITLGRKQIDMVHYQFGLGYSGSIVVHFGSTALCILAVECNAREMALWAFVTVVWGCIPQALICIQIAMNLKKREELALALWEQDGNLKKETNSVIRKMVGHLKDTDVYYNKEYRNMLCKMIAAWMKDFYGKRDSFNRQKVLRSVSALFQEIAEKTEETDRESVEEEILSAVCEQLKEDDKMQDLFCCGYFRFIYEQAGKKLERLEKRIDRMAYYLQKEDTQNKYIADRMRAFLWALEWFLFLNERAEVPKGMVVQGKKNSQTKEIFEQLILSIFEDGEKENLKNAEIAWKQVDLEG